MESFFVNVFISKDTSIGSKTFKDSLVEYLNAEGFQTKKLASSRFTLIDNLVDMDAYEENRFFVVSLMGCFSCFSAACSLINDVINALFAHYNVLSIKIMGDEVDLSVRDFTKIFYKEYGEKYRLFKSNITNLTFNAAPSTFYKKLRRIDFWGVLGRLAISLEKKR